MAESLSVRLRELRQIAEITQREADRLAGIHRGHVWQLEDGGRDNPTTHTLLALARLYGTSLDWLATGEGTAPTPSEVRAAVARARGPRSEVA